MQNGLNLFLMKIIKNYHSKEKRKDEMMNNFAYDIPTKVYFGENQLDNLGTELSKFGKKVLLTYGGGSIKKIGLYA